MQTLPVPTLTRRHLLGSAAAGLGALAVAPARAATPEPEMRERATRWLALLSEPQRDTATFGFDHRTRRRWNYMLGSAFAEGLALENMTSEQKDAALDLLDTGLSNYGVETAMNIMLQQDILRDEWGKGSSARNRERFSLMIFGEPSPTGPWGWRWEGHHLTISFTLLGDEVIAQTPKAFSSEPNTVPSGPHKGLVVLPENEVLGRALFADLKGASRTAALLRESSYGNIIAKPGREDRIEKREGVALGDLSTSQADLLRRLIALYTSDHLTGTLRDAQEANVAAEDVSAIRFGWAGPNEAEQSMYYRIHGESFLIEFATLRNQPLHHHTIVHDLQRNFGDHRLG
ncbi:MAG: DUF3500 domain-containing protein [Pseudomonadota bacterium]